MAMWKEIPGYPGYEASDEGEIRSILRIIVCKNGAVKTYKGRVLKPGTHSTESPYPYYQLGKGRSLSAHKAVALAFLGPVPPGMEVRHIDGDHANPRLINLAYGTPKQNQADRVKHGTHLRGERHPTSKLKQSQVEEIKRRVAAGEKQALLAAEFDTTQSNISLIASGERWKI